MKTLLTIMFSFSFLATAFSQHNTATGMSAAKHHHAVRKSYSLHEGSEKVTFQIVSVKKVSKTAYVVTMHLSGSAQHAAHLSFSSRDRVKVLSQNSFPGGTNEQVLGHIIFAKSVAGNYPVTLNMTDGQNKEFSVHLGKNYAGSTHNFLFRQTGTTLRLVKESHNGTV